MNIKRFSGQAATWLSIAALLVACGDDGSDKNTTNAGQVAFDAGVDAANMNDTQTTGDIGEADTAEPTLNITQFTEPGPHGIGFQRHEISYTPLGATEARELRVVIWYPTEATDGELGQYADLLPREGVFKDAPPSLEAPAPVMVFTHGSRAVAEQSWFMAEFFTTHGWLVMAMDHPGNTLFEDGDLGPYVELRPQDVRAAHDYIDDLPEAESLAGLFGDDRLVAGHSFGGYTALAVAGATYDVDSLAQSCQVLEPESCDIIETAGPNLEMGFGDPRFKAVIPMTPGGFVLFGDGLQTIDIPVLLMTGNQDGTTPDNEEGDPIWAALSDPDAIRMEFLTGGHLTFSNLCEVVPDFGADEGCGPGFITPEDAHTIINAYALAFARLHLMDDPQAALWFKETPLIEDTVRVSTK